MNRKKILLRVTISLILVGFITVIYLGFIKAGTGPRKEISIIVKEGENFSEIVDKLVKKDVIKSAISLKIAAENKKIDTKIQPGEYVFKTNSSIDEVVEVFKKGPKREYVTVTIPEGFSVKEITTRFGKKTTIREELFLDIALNNAREYKKKYSFLKDNPTDSLEGYLFPKTYTFEKPVEENDIVDSLLSQLGKEIKNINFNKIKAKGYNLHQILTIASLIEKEAKVPEERPIIASVIYNRIEKGMFLQIDATIQYALGKTKTKLTHEDLEISSPYNTYQNKGLPPGPICNPGLKSIEAAANPADTDYLYYVLSDRKGHHTFTSSYREFLKAKEKYRDILNGD